MSQSSTPIARDLPLLSVDQILFSGARSRLRVRGELDLASSDLLEDALDGELRNERRFVRVDLSDLTFCDGIGLDMLGRVHARFDLAGGELRFTHVPPHVTRLMEMLSSSTLLESSTASDPRVDSRPAHGDRRATVRPLFG
jgi:anti-anti-sigma factor